MTPPQNQEAMPTKTTHVVICYQCKAQRGINPGQDVSCPDCNGRDGKYEVHVRVLPWDEYLSVLEFPAPPDAVSESRIAEIRDWAKSWGQLPLLQHQLANFISHGPEAIRTLLAELDRRKEQR